MFNAQNRIRQLMAERGWTIYRLAQESGLSQTTISNIFKRNNQPPYNTYLCSIPLDFPRVPLHWHDELELIYIKKGMGRITVDFREYKVKGPTLVLILPGQLHSIDQLEDAFMEYENIIFNPSLKLYEAVSFPDEWKITQDILSDVYACDSVFIEKEGVQYLLTNEMYHNVKLAFAVISILNFWKHNPS